MGIGRFRLLGLDGRCEVFWVSGGVQVIEEGEEVV